MVSKEDIDSTAKMHDEMYQQTQDDKSKWKNESTHQYEQAKLYADLASRYYLQYEMICREFFPNDPVMENPQLGHQPMGIDAPKMR